MDLGNGRLRVVTKNLRVPLRGLKVDEKWKMVMIDDDQLG